MLPKDARILRWTLIYTWTLLEIDELTADVAFLVVRHARNAITRCDSFQEKNVTFVTLELIANILVKVTRASFNFQDTPFEKNSGPWKNTSIQLEDFSLPAFLRFLPKARIILKADQYRKVILSVLSIDFLGSAMRLSSSAEKKDIENNIAAFDAFTAVFKFVKLVLETNAANDFPIVNANLFFNRLLKVSLYVLGVLKNKNFLCGRFEVLCGQLLVNYGKNGRSLGLVKKDPKVDISVEQWCLQVPDDYGAESIPVSVDF